MINILWRNARGRSDGLSTLSEKDFLECLLEDG